METTLQVCPGGWKAGCFAHEVFKAQLRHQSWTKHFLPLEKVWNENAQLRASGLHVHADTFLKEYNDWMHLAYRCPVPPLFRELGGLLADVASEVGCQKTSEHIHLKFGPDRLPFFASATGLPGMPAYQNALEALHKKFERDVTGKVVHTHASFVNALHKNVASSTQFHKHFPTNSRQSRVTNLPALRAMLEKAAKFHADGGRPTVLPGAPGEYYFKSNTIPQFVLPDKKRMQFPVGHWHEVEAVQRDLGSAQLCAEQVRAGLNGDLSHFESVAPKRSQFTGYVALKRLDIFADMYLSMHRVAEDADGIRWCTCPGYWDDSVCWHCSYYEQFAQDQCLEGMVADEGVEEEEEEEDAVEDQEDQGSSAEEEVPQRDAGEGHPNMPQAYRKERHGPLDSLVLARLLEKLHSHGHLGKVLADAGRKTWKFEYAKSGRSCCKGCQGAIAMKEPRLEWTIQMQPGQSRLVGGNAGFWHVACGILTSKLVASKNLLSPVTPQVVAMWSGATTEDAPVIDSLAAADYVFLKAAMRV